MIKKIAALYTCHNRKDKTVHSIMSLFSAVRFFNNTSNDSIELLVFLVDDGSTDGTADAVNSLSEQSPIIILEGDGSLFWAGGMRLAWETAMQYCNDWSYYFLINDDTVLKEDCFSELIKTQRYCLDKYGEEGLVSGITCSRVDSQQVTYGGDVILNRFTGKTKRLGLSVDPQLVDLANANLLLVPQGVVEIIGIFHKKYQHGRADSDYAMTARRNGIPVYLTADCCGYCENDHDQIEDLREKVVGMTIRERIAYFANPLHSSKDYLFFILRNFPFKYPLAVLFRWMNIYTPRLYYAITIRRMK